MSQMLKLLEQAINDAGNLTENWEKSLQLLSGKKLRIVLTDLNVSFVLCFTPERIALFENIETPVDAEILGTTTQLFHHAWKSKWGNPSLNVGNVIEVSGDVEVAGHCQEFLRGLSIDWEGWAAKFLGDASAHQLSRLLEEGKRLVKETKHDLKAITSDYLQEELRATPTPQEFRNFWEEIQDLQKEIDRLVTRIDHLSVDLEEK